MNLSITSTGHASVIIQSDELTVFIDPVLTDLHEHGICSFYPPRKILLEKLPEPDFIFISHYHGDHLDIETLNLFSNKRVYAPYNCHKSIIEHTSHAPQKISAFQEIELKKNKVKALITPSEQPIEEFGIVFVAGEISIWDQADTTVSQKTNVRVSEFLGKDPSLVLCPYQPTLEFGCYWVSEIKFPTERYQRLIESALASRGEILIPHSSGQRNKDENSWFNKILFPIKKEKFISDLQNIDSQQTCINLNPGESICYDDIKFKKSKTDYIITKTEKDDLIDFKPNVSPPTIFDGSATMEEEKFIKNKIEIDFLKKLEKINFSKASGPIRHMIDQRAKILISIIFKEKTLFWHLSFENKNSSYIKQKYREWDYLFCYRASTLLGAFKEEQPYFFFRAYRAKKEKLLLNPLRLHDIDPFYYNDGTLHWNPLIELFKVEKFSL